MASLDKRADRLAQVRSQVNYHAHRLTRYRELHGSRPCDRLSQLELAYRTACDRLAGEEAPGHAIGAGSDEPTLAMGDR